MILHGKPMVFQWNFPCTRYFLGIKPMFFFLKKNLCAIFCGEISLRISWFPWWMPWFTMGIWHFPPIKMAFFFAPKLVASWGISRWRSWTKRAIELCGISGLVPGGHVRGWQRPTKTDAEFGKVRMSWIFSAFYKFYLSRLLYNHQESTLLNES